MKNLGVIIGIFALVIGGSVSNVSSAGTGPDDTGAQIQKLIKGIYADAPVGQSDPLVLDLDGDGLELTQIYAPKMMFDVDGDKFAEFTGWVSGDDGLLAIDINNNGKIDDVSELFGSASESGFSQLAAYDTNLDGVIDANDAQFADLRIWQDLNSDANTDAGELKTLSAHKIISINLNWLRDSTKNANNTVVAIGTFTRSDATTGQIGDVNFRIDNFNTVYTGDKAVEPIIAATNPNLKGHGTLTDLHVALALENDNALAVSIGRVMPKLNIIDLNKLRARVRPVLTAWTQALPDQMSRNNPDVPILVTTISGSRVIKNFAAEVSENIKDLDGIMRDKTFWRLADGSPVKDADGATINFPTFPDVIGQHSDIADQRWEILTSEELDFAERYVGEDIPIDQPGALNLSAISSISALLQTIDKIIDSLAIRLASQGPLSIYFDSLDYSVTADRFTPSSDRQLIPMLEAIFAAAPADEVGVRKWLKDWDPIFDAVLVDYARGGSHLSNTYSFLFSNLAVAFEATNPNIGIVDAAVIFGIPDNLIFTGAGILTGTDEPDIFYMDSSDQIARGGPSMDTYVFSRGFGTDIIDDREPTIQQPDLIRFANIASEEISLKRDGIDLIISVKGTSDVVTVIGQFVGRRPDLLGANQIDERGIAEIAFADGVVYDKIDIAKLVSNPRKTSDTYIGTNEIDFLDGGAGDDILIGGNQTDIYSFGIGYDHDIIKEQMENVLHEDHDQVVFGAGITPQNITLSRDGNSDDLILKITGTNDQLTVEGQFSATYAGQSDVHWFNRVEIFSFASRHYFDWADIMRMLLAQGKTDGDDILYGFSNADILDGGAGDDFLQGGNENDVYMFGFGYGHDRIREGRSNTNSGSLDIVLFQPSVARSDVSVVRPFGTNDLVITLSDGATLTIQDTFEVIFGIEHDEFNRIEEFHFKDYPDQAFTLQSVQKSLLESTSGNDLLEGFALEDILDGGAGDDMLFGRSGDDTYIFGRGYGHDRVADIQSTIAPTKVGDRILFKQGISPADIEIMRDDSVDLILKIRGTDDILTIKGQFDRTALGDRPKEIEFFEFADGTVLTAEKFQ